jgi:hypothetical protein
MQAAAYPAPPWIAADGLPVPLSAQSAALLLQKVDTLLLYNNVRRPQAAGHKALVFCQTQQMLDIIEKLVRRKAQEAADSPAAEHGTGGGGGGGAYGVAGGSTAHGGGSGGSGLGWRYHRMDGATPVAMRSRLIDDFNANPRIAFFLLTTKVCNAAGMYSETCGVWRAACVELPAARSPGSAILPAFELCAAVPDASHSEHSEPPLLP